MTDKKRMIPHINRGADWPEKAQRYWLMGIVEAGLMPGDEKRIPHYGKVNEMDEAR